MTKKILCLVFSLILVMALAVTGVYADSVLPNHYTSSNVSMIETSSGFILSNSNNSEGYLRFTGVYGISGSVTVTLEPSFSNPNYKAFTFNDGALGVDYSGAFSDVVGFAYRSTYPSRLDYTDAYGTTFSSGSFSFSFGRNNASSSTTVNFYVPSNCSATFEFSSLVINDVIIFESPSVIGETVGFSIPAGYALVIDGSCEILERSYYINNSWNFYKNGSLRINGAFEKSLSNTYIRDGYSPDVALTFDQFVQWDAMNVNILGSASDYESYSSEIVSVGEGSCYVIGYPTLFGTGDENTRLLYTNAVDMVCGLYLNYTSRPSFRFVAIESLSGYRNDGTFYTYSAFRPAVADVSGNVTEGSGGVVITPESSLPSGGGNTGQPPVDEDGSLLGTISRFVNDIKRLLSSAVEAINTLVNDGSSFMQSIGTMFTWLPAPLTSLIIAGFTVLLVVGVLKVLWR